jgi:ABC-type nickel/cobalt efflux system permease component RcnA
VNDGESPYAAPRARIGDALENRGSVLAGFFLGWAALLAGGLLAVAWTLFVIMALAIESRLVERMAPFGYVVVPLVPVLAARWCWRRGRRDTSNGIFMALVSALAVAGLWVAFYWLD